MVYWIDLFRFDTRVDKSTYIEICNEFISNGYEVCYVTSYDKEKEIPKTAKFNIDYIYSPKIPILFRFILIIRIALFILKNVKKEDLIINQPNGMLLSIVKHFKPCKLHLDIRTIPVGIKTLKDRLDRLFYWKFSIKILINKYNSFSFITENLKKAVEDEFNLYFNDYIIWTSGVNTDLFNYSENTSNTNTKDIIELFYHGQISIERGILNLIKAIEHVVLKNRKNICLKLVGAGVDFKYFEQLIKELGMNNYIKLTGLQPYELMPQLINKADICICPLPNKQGWNVSSPLKIFEYLACGKPIICTPIPAHLNVLSNINGVIFTEGENERALAEAIIYACDHLDLLKSNAKDLRELVLKKFTWKKQAANLINYLKNKELL